MKTIIITTLAILTTATMASAEFKASTEYAVEADTFALGLDYHKDLYAFDVSIGGDWTAPLGNGVTFVGTEIGAGYNVSESMRLYTKVSFDSSFDYTEAVVGAEYKF